MRISATTPPIYGNSKVSKNQNTQKNVPFAPQKADSVSFKRADVYFYKLLEKEKLREYIDKQMPEYTVKQLMNKRDMLESLFAVKKAYDEVAHKFPDHLNIYVGAKKFGWFEPYKVYIAAGYKECGAFNTKQAWDLLKTIEKHRDEWPSKENYNIARELLVDALQPENYKKLEKGELPVCKMLQKDCGRNTIVRSFSPINTYYKGDEWYSYFANPEKIDRDVDLMKMYYEVLEKNKLLKPLPEPERPYNPADYFIPY